MNKLTHVILLFMVTQINSNGQGIEKIADGKFYPAWELAYPDSAGSKKIAWTEATVPGAVQLDIARAEKYEPYYFAENWKDYRWMEDKQFIYRTRFYEPVLEEGQAFVFVSKGIDYEFEISLNGKLLLHQEGMFTPVRLDLTRHLQAENELKIKIFPVPKSHTDSEDRTQADQSTKPAVSYVWDWHPRLIPSGIWDETWLEVVQESHILDSWMNYSMKEDLSFADIKLEIVGEQLANHEIHWVLKDESGNVVADEKVTAIADEMILRSSLKDPELWWPHDHGKPYLYSSEIILSDPDGRIIQEGKSKIGFRRISLVMNQGGWDGPQGFPKSRSVAPVQLEINGREIFSKGTNWVNPEIFPGLITYERYHELLKLAKEANFNLLRVWGGGIVNKDAFYELCDEMGLMVWTEFPLACNNYKDTPAYLEVLRQESASIIRRIRKHPSQAVWSGGNELFNAWSRMTDQSLALRLLNSQCLELDPQTPYINTSPLIGMGHGHYVFRDMESGEEVYSMMQRAEFTAYTEFGMPSPSSVDVLKTIIPEDELWPPKPGTSWESHHAYNAWVGDTWLMQNMIEDYFGKSKNLEELVEHGQLLQCEGYKAIYEEARRQKPYCSMALNWCYNEPWPTAANNSLVNYPSHAKPAFYAVRDACRPVLASAKITQLQWKEGDTLALELWLLNDSYDIVDGGRMKLSLLSGEELIEILSWDYAASEANTNIQGPTARLVLPKLSKKKFWLRLEVEGKPMYNSEYLLLYKEKQNKTQETALLNQ